MEQKQADTGRWLVTQTELADVLDVSRGTLTSWQRAGLPFEATGYKNANTYDVVLCLHWAVGREAFVTRSKRVPSDAAFVAAIGFFVGTDNIDAAAAMLRASLSLESAHSLKIAAQARGWWIGVEGTPPAIA